MQALVVREDQRVGVANAALAAEAAERLQLGVGHQLAGALDIASMAGQRAALAAARLALTALCQRLATKVLAVHVDGVPLSVYFKSHGEHMTLHTDHEGTPDATLSGTPFSLLRLAGPTPEAVLRGGAVHIEGDAEVAQTFSELLKAAQPVQAVFYWVLQIFLYCSVLK